MDRGIRSTDKIKVAVIVGSHPYDVPGFRGLFDRMPDVDYFIQEFDVWASDPRAMREEDGYDVHLFYNMHAYHAEDLVSVRKDRDAICAEAIERLGETPQGILVLHHALLNFWEWGAQAQANETWSKICNVEGRHLKGYSPGIEMMTHIADPDHPITHGLHDWRRMDETFVIDEPGPESDVLVTTDCPQSTKALGWAHTYRNARVFCFQPGHDNQAYVDPTFQTLLWRGIRWLAQEI